MLTWPSLATGAHNSYGGRAKKRPRTVKITSDARVTGCLSARAAVDPDIHGFSGIFHDEEATPIADLDSTPRVLNKPRITKPLGAVAFTWQKQSCAAGRRAVVKVWMTRTGSRRLANNFVYLFFCLRFLEVRLRCRNARFRQSIHGPTGPVRQILRKCPKTWIQETGTDARISDSCRPDRCSWYSLQGRGFQGKKEKKPSRCSLDE